MGRSHVYSHGCDMSRNVASQWPYSSLGGQGTLTPTSNHGHHNPSSPYHTHLPLATLERRDAGMLLWWRRPLQGPVSMVTHWSKRRLASCGTLHPRRLHNAAIAIQARHLERPPWMGEVVWVKHWRKLLCVYKTQTFQFHMFLCNQPLLSRLILYSPLRPTAPREWGGGRKGTWGKSWY